MIRVLGGLTLGLVALTLLVVGLGHIAWLGGHGEPEPWRYALAALALLAVVIATGRHRAIGALGAALALVLLGAAARPFVHAEGARQWWEPQARQAYAVRDGDMVHVHHIRSFTYRSASDWTPRWRDDTYRISDITRAWFVLTQFSGFEGIGHVMVAFDFADGRHLVISAEIRREDGEEFDPLRGLFRQFELVYIVADETDAIGLRTHIHRDDTWMFPIEANPATTQRFFVHMLERANALSAHPEWYNTATNSCSSNLAAHYEAINNRSLGFDYRILMPGYSDTLLGELGLLNGLSPAEARATHRINERALAGPLDDTFSARIRERGAAHSSPVTPPLTDAGSGRAVGSGAAAPASPEAGSGAVASPTAGSGSTQP